MTETSSGTLPHANAEEFSNGACLPDDFKISDFMDDFLLELIPSISENALPSNEDLISFISQDTPIKMPSSESSTDPTKIFSNPHGLNDFSSSTSDESEASLFSKMIDSLHSLDDSLGAFNNVESSDNSQANNGTNSNEEKMNLFESAKHLNDSNDQLKMEYSASESVMTQVASPQQNLATVEPGPWQQTVNPLKTRHESTYLNDLPNSVKRMKLSHSQSHDESLIPTHSSVGVELFMKNSMFVQKNRSQQEEYYAKSNQQELFFPNVAETTNGQKRQGILEKEGDMWNFDFNQPNEMSLPNWNNQSALFKTRSEGAVQNYSSVQSQAVAPVKPIPNHANKSYNVATHQQSEKTVTMDTYWQQSNGKNQIDGIETKSEWGKSPRSLSITECHHPEDYDKFYDLSWNQYKEICRYDPPQGITQRVNQKRDVPFVGGNQIFQIYNNTTHRSSNTNSPSQSCAGKNELGKEEMLFNRGSVIIRNNSILRKRAEDFPGEGPYGETTCEEIGAFHDGLNFAGGGNLEHNQLNLLPIQQVKCEVLDFSNTTTLPSTSTSYMPPLRGVVETPLMREHRLVRSKLSELLERIDSVILQKGVKEKSLKTEELDQVDIHDEKKLKKSVDTLSSYFKEALSLYAKYEGRQITKDELSREAKRLKNKFSGMKSRVKKKKEFICEKKEFFQLVHEFKQLRSFSDDLENFQNLVVRELDNFNKSGPLTHFFLKTVISQMHTPNIDSWIDTDYSESVKKMENL